MEFKLNPNKIKEINFLLNKFHEKEEQFNTPKFSFLLGSGCSVNSNIPTGNGVKELCKKLSFIDNHVDGHIFKKYTFPFFFDYIIAIDEYILKNKKEFDVFVLKKEKEFRSLINSNEIKSKLPKGIKDLVEHQASLANEDSDLMLMNFFAQKIHNDSLYGKWFQEYSQDSRERQNLIEKIIEDKKPSGEYILLASLINQGLIHNVFTTNFDDLLNEALMIYFGKKARVYSHNEIAKYISIGSKKPNIIKLHGDYLYEDLKNVEDETFVLGSNMGVKFKEALSYLDLIVVGYSGADQSIMSSLEELKESRTFSLLWCGRDETKLHWRVINLINETKNSFFVKVENFETLLFKLWNISSKELPDLEILARSKQLEVKSLLEKFKISLDQNINVSNEEKVDFNSMLFDLAFKEKNKKIKIDLYTKLLNSDPKNIAALNNLGLAYSNIDENILAITYYSKAIDLYPEYTTAYMNRGTSFYRIGKYEDAIKDINFIIQIDPAFAMAYSLKGIILYRQNKLNNVLPLLNKAIELSPNAGSVFVNRGLFYLEEGRLDEAANDFDLAESLGVDDYEILCLNRAVIARRKGNYDEAFRLLELAKEYNDDHSNIYGTMALVYADQNKHDEFYTYIDLALKKGCPVKTYLDDPGFKNYLHEVKFQKLLQMYENEL